MLTKLRARLSYANVVSTLCLFILLGGSAYAVTRLDQNSVRSKHIVNGQVKSADVLDGSVGNADLAGNAVNSTKISDGSVGDADLAPREGLNVPIFETCEGGNHWTGSGVAFARSARFWKDRSGVVHLQGAVSCSGNADEGDTIFNLPSDYRPSGGVVRWAALAGGASIAQIAVLDNGNVVYDGPNNATADDYISLDGLTFRAEN